MGRVTRRKTYNDIKEASQPSAVTPSKKSRKPHRTKTPEQLSRSQLSSSHKAHASSTPIDRRSAACKLYVVGHPSPGDGAQDDFPMSQVPAEVGWDHGGHGQAQTSSHLNICDIIKTIDVDKKRSSEQSDFDSIPGTPPINLYQYRDDSPCSLDEPSTPVERVLAKRPKAKTRSRAAKQGLTGKAMLESLRLALEAQQAQEKLQEQVMKQEADLRRSERLSQQVKQSTNDVDSAVTNGLSDESVDLFEESLVLPPQKTPKRYPKPAANSVPILTTPKRPPRGHDSCEELWTDDDAFDDSFMQATQALEKTGFLSPKIQPLKRKSSGTPEGGLSKKAGKFTSPVAPSISVSPKSVTTSSNTFSRNIAQTKVSVTTTSIHPVAKTTQAGSHKLPFQSYKNETSRFSKDTSCIQTTSNSAGQPRPRFQRHQSMPLNPSLRPGTTNNQLHRPMRPSVRHPSVRQPAFRPPGPAPMRPPLIRPVGNIRKPLVTQPKSEGIIRRPPSISPTAGSARVRAGSVSPPPSAIQGAASSGVLDISTTSISFSSTQFGDRLLATSTQVAQPAQFKEPLKVQPQPQTKPVPPKFSTKQPQDPAMDMSISDELLASLAEPDDLLDSQACLEMLQSPVKSTVAAAAGDAEVKKPSDQGPSAAKAQPTKSSSDEFDFLDGLMMDDTPKKAVPKAKRIATPKKQPMELLGAEADFLAADVLDDEDDLLGADVLHMIEEVELRASQEKQKDASRPTTRSTKPAPETTKPTKPAPETTNSASAQKPSFNFKPSNKVVSSSSSGLTPMTTNINISKSSTTPKSATGASKPSNSILVPRQDSTADRVSASSIATNRSKSDAVASGVQKPRPVSVVPLKQSTGTSFVSSNSARSMNNSVQMNSLGGSNSSAIDSKSSVQSSNKTSDNNNAPSSSPNVCTMADIEKKRIEAMKKRQNRLKLSKKTSNV